MADFKIVYYKRKKLEITLRAQRFAEKRPA
jgi:hypothetical protein